MHPFNIYLCRFKYQNLLNHHTYNLHCVGYPNIYNTCGPYFNCYNGGGMSCGPTPPKSRCGFCGVMVSKSCNLNSGIPHSSKKQQGTSHYQNSIYKQLNPANANMDPKHKCRVCGKLFLRARSLVVSGVDEGRHQTNLSLILNFIFVDFTKETHDDP